VGTELECKIIELDRNRNNVVLSRRAFLEESMSEGRKAFLQSLKKGERRTGAVSSIVNFGVFVDLGGGVDGLVHVSELSWKHVDHPSEVVQVGQDVEVEVLDVDLDRERVSLSLKATQEDPWREFERRYQAGEVISGSITKLVPFGAFVRVGEGIEGLVHISELSDQHVESPEQVVSVGQQVRVKVVDVDVPRRRISLSIRRVTDQEAGLLPDGEIEPEIEPEAEAQPSSPTGSVPEAAAEAPADEVVPEAPVAEAPGPGAVAVEAPVADAQVAEAPVPDAPAAEAPVAEAPAAEAAEAETGPEAEETVQEPGPAPKPEAAPAVAEHEAPAPEAGGSDDDISLESILEDLRRREGRTD
jgi:small subunit ribosomal protein S1